MTSIVVDTNVAVAANRKNTHADLECQMACVTKLKDVCRDTIIVLDNSNLIFDEYKDRLSFAGAPGVGDACPSGLPRATRTRSETLELCPITTFGSRQGHRHRRYPLETGKIRFLMALFDGSTPSRPTPPLTPLAPRNLGSSRSLIASPNMFRL